MDCIVYFSYLYTFFILNIFYLVSLIDFLFLLNIVNISLSVYSILILHFRSFTSLNMVQIFFCVLPFFIVNLSSNLVILVYEVMFPWSCQSTTLVMYIGERGQIHMSVSIGLRRGQQMNSGAEKPKVPQTHWLEFHCKLVGKSGMGRGCSFWVVSTIPGFEKGWGVGVEG